MFGNSNLRLIPKRSTASGKVPSTLDHLELCLNTADGLVWIGDSQGNPILLTELTNSPRIFTGTFSKTTIPKS
jgi:hypothetical protein